MSPPEDTRSPFELPYELRRGLQALCLHLLPLKNSSVNPKLSSRKPTPQLLESQPPSLARGFVRFCFLGVVRGLDGYLFKPGANGRGVQIPLF